MGIEGLIHVKKAVTALNSNQVREMADRRVLVGLHAATPESYARMENFLLSEFGAARRLDSERLIVRAPANILGQPSADVNIYDEGVLAPPGALIFHPTRPDIVAQRAISKHPEFGMALARSFAPFRQPFVEKTINKISRENTMFSLATALPDVIPSVIELPWAVAEFASDTAFLTMNQIRMAFHIAGASDREVGYMEQKSEIAAVIGGAFGWRAIARQIVGKIPFGGGLIGKAAIAYAGTKVVGLSLDKFYSLGYKYSREERQSLYSEAYGQGRKIALKILTLLRPDLANRYAGAEERPGPYNPAGAASGRP
jgi:hypothetical protein